MASLMITMAELKLADSLMPITRMVVIDHHDQHRDQVENSCRMRQSFRTHSRRKRHHLQPLLVIEHQRQFRWWP